MNESLHVLAVATNDYVGFIPLFAHYLFTAYPDYHATIFVRGVPEDVNDALVGHEHAHRFNVVDGEFDGYPRERSDNNALKYLLFTTDRVRKYFSKTEYAYIADIDVLYVREDPGILESHLEHCETLGLPYSNAIRENVPPTITGVQFVTAEYIDRIRDASDVWDAKFKEHGMSLIKRPQRVPDERVLYELVRDSGIGLPPHPDDLPDDLGHAHLPSHPRFRPSHGINIGFARHPELLEYSESRERMLNMLLHAMHTRYFNLIPEWGKIAWGHICEKWRK
jgi:hypothetical protein